MNKIHCAMLENKTQSPAHEQFAKTTPTKQQRNLHKTQTWTADNFYIDHNTLKKKEKQYAENNDNKSRIKQNLFTLKWTH